MKTSDLVYVVSTLACCLIIGIAANKIGFREGVATERASQRVTSDYVAEKMRDLGMCEWAEVFKKQHHCPNPHAPDPGFSPFSGRSSPRPS